MRKVLHFNGATFGIRPCRLKAGVSDGTFEFKTHLLGKLVDGAHPALGSALEIGDLQRHLAGKQQCRNCALELVSQKFAAPQAKTRTGGACRLYGCERSKPLGPISRLSSWFEGAWSDAAWLSAAPGMTERECAGINSSTGRPRSRDGSSTP